MQKICAWRTCSSGIVICSDRINDVGVQFVSHVVNFIARLPGGDIKVYSRVVPRYVCGWEARIYGDNFNIILRCVGLSVLNVLRVVPKRLCHHTSSQYRNINTFCEQIPTFYVTYLTTQIYLIICGYKSIEIYNKLFMF